jgi:formylglycine-generating enzyme required for sulfatase activity
MILDACRNNLFARSFRTETQGLAQMDAPVGTYIAYATAPGSVAADGEGRNGTYTAALLRAMRTPGLKVEEVFKRVRLDVSRATAGKQWPWDASSLVGDFFFVSPASAPAASGPAAPAPARPEPAGGGRPVTEPAARPGGDTAVDLGSSVRIELVYVRAGSFDMGGNQSDEQPVHRVTISKGFLMGKYEVTQGQWKAVMGSNPSHFTGNDDRPVEQVSWDDCQ